MRPTRTLLVDEIEAPRHAGSGTMNRSPRVYVLAGPLMVPRALEAERPFTALAPAGDHRRRNV